MTRIFFFLLGFGLSVVGFTYIISYLNLFTIGYNLKEYLLFISKRYECVVALLGLLIITLSIFKGGNKIDIRI